MLQTSPGYFREVVWLVKYYNLARSIKRHQKLFTPQFLLHPFTTNVFIYTNASILHQRAFKSELFCRTGLLHQKRVYTTNTGILEAGAFYARSILHPTAFRQKHFTPKTFTPEDWKLCAYPTRSFCSQKKFQHAKRSKKKYASRNAIKLRTLRIS